MMHRQELWRYRPEIVSSHRLGLLALLLTIAYGFASAAGLFGVSRDTLITHLSAGMLGWTTISVLGLTLALFGGAPGRSPRDRLVGRVVLGTAAAIIVGILAIWSGNVLLRAALGVAQLGVIAFWLRFVSFSLRRAGLAAFSTSQLALTVALVTFGIGSALGLAAWRAPAGATFLAQTVGFLYLAAFAVGEWRLRNDYGARSPVGDAAVWILLGSGFAIATGVLFAFAPLVALAIPLVLAGGGLLVIRLGRGALAAAWASPAGERHAAAAVPWLAVNAALLAAFCVTIAGADGRADAVPAGLVDALGQTLFVGVLGNQVFGAMRDEGLDLPRRWPWADHVLFWGLNLGLTGSLLALAADAPYAAAVAAGVTGASALLGVLAHGLRLGGRFPMPVTRTQTS